MSDEKAGVFVPLPLPDEQVFRYQAADDVLELLYTNPHRQFSITELREITGHGGKSIDEAVGILWNLGLVRREREGRRTLIGIDQRAIRKPDDPILEIPQAEFREPVREFLRQAGEKQGENLVGVVLFGSVARGRADRTSDVDIQVIVRENLLDARRQLQAVRRDLETRTFDGSRYEIQLLVESVDSTLNYGEKLREIFSEGIVLHETGDLDDVREVVFSGK